MKTGKGFRYPLVFHTFSKATIEARFVDYKKDIFVDELLSLFEDIDGMNIAVIRANGYGAKPKIEISRFDDEKVTNALVAMCNRVQQN